MQCSVDMQVTTDMHAGIRRASAVDYFSDAIEFRTVDEAAIR